MTQINADKILDGSVSWLDIVDTGKTVADGVQTADVDPFHIDRIQNFVNYDHPDGLKASSLDLSTLLILLKYRKCKITIPSYKCVTNSKIKDTQVQVGFERTGQIVDLVSNQNTFHFSVRILNESWVEEKKNRAFEFCPRSYTITDTDGNLSHNWDKFDFAITDKERDYFKNCMDENGKLNCPRFVNHQLAHAFYTPYYRDIKLLVERLVAERKYLTDLRKKYIPLIPKTESFVFEEDKKTQDDVQTEKTIDNYVSRKVLCFESKVVPKKEHNLVFNYINEKLSPKEIVVLCDSYLKGLIGVTGEYKFLCRLIELAFTKMNPYREDLTPKDLQTYNRTDCKWIPHTVKFPRSRTEWYNLEFQDYDIFCRYYMKSIKEKVEVQ